MLAIFQSERVKKADAIFHYGQVTEIAELLPAHQGVQYKSGKFGDLALQMISAIERRPKNDLVVMHYIADGDASPQ